MGRQRPSSSCHNTALGLARATRRLKRSLMVEIGVMGVIWPVNAARIHGPRTIESVTAQGAGPREGRTWRARIRSRTKSARPSLIDSGLGFGGHAHELRGFAFPVRQQPLRALAPGFGVVEFNQFADGLAGGAIELIPGCGLQKALVVAAL